MKRIQKQITTHHQASNTYYSVLNRW